MATGGGEEAAAVQTARRNCRLGKRYEQGAGKEYFGKTAAYARLEKPHAGVHSCVHHSVRLSSGDWANNADLREDIMLEMEKAEDASSEVVNLINAMVMEKHGDS